MGPRLSESLRDATQPAADNRAPIRAPGSAESILTALTYGTM